MPGPGDLRNTLETDGYIVVPTGLPAPVLEAVVADIWRHAGAVPADPATWYQPAIIRPQAGMVEMYHYQSMWDVRQHPAVYRIFRSLHGTGELWVSIDRVAFKPPVRPDQPSYDQPGFIHWDTDISRYPHIPFRLQGVLALEDTSADMGGFQCVPSIYRDQQRFLDEQAQAGPVPRAPDIGGHPIVKVPLAAGDLAIWKTTLLHGNGRNSAGHPRLAQYLTMNPLPPAGRPRETERRERVGSWSACTPPPGDAFPGDPRRIEEQRGQPATLGPLGRRLLGLDEWAPHMSPQSNGHSRQNAHNFATPGDMSALVGAGARR